METIPAKLCDLAGMILHIYLWASFIWYEVDFSSVRTCGIERGIASSSTWLKLGESLNSRHSKVYVTQDFSLKSAIRNSRQSYLFFEFQPDVLLRIVLGCFVLRIMAIRRQAGFMMNRISKQHRAADKTSRVTIWVIVSALRSKKHAACIL